MTEERYKLGNGQYIESIEQSRVMSIISAAHPEKNLDYPWDESGMSQLFGECYSYNTKFCSTSNTWYSYSDGAWRKDTGALIVAERVKEFCRLIFFYTWEIEDEQLRADYIKFAAKMGDRRWRERLLRDAQSVTELKISAEEFDAHPELINCLNGTYDLENMRFREHDSKDYLTMQTRFDYTLQNVSCPRWEQFIDEITLGDKDKARYLQKALGYSMFGSSKEECMFILHGKTTRNGKSTLLGAIHYLLGDYAAVSPVSIICRGDRAKNADAPSPMLASLKGKRFVTMAESSQYGKLDEETIKQLTGGEEISARNIYERQMTFLPQFTLWLSCNDLPAVHDKSLFASDRIKVIEFNKHFSEAERDVTLKDLFKNPVSMQGIFSWLVAGFFWYKREGLSMSDDMKRVIKQYESDNDLVLQFLEEECQRTKGKSTQAKALYNKYKIWARSNGYYIMNAKKFNAGLAAHSEWYDKIGVSMGYKVYNGVCLKQNLS